MKLPWLARRSMLILMGIFFLVPFAIRGARLALEQVSNDVQDWIPSSAATSGDLAWFNRHFGSEPFVLVSWQGCTGAADDARFRMFLDKLVPELPPSLRSPDTEHPTIPVDTDATDRTETRDLTESEHSVGDASNRPSVTVDERLGLYVRQFRMSAEEAADAKKFVGNEWNLAAAGDVHDNWAGENEKWLRGGQGDWFFLHPSGELYRRSAKHWWSRLWEWSYQRLYGGVPLKGDLIARFGQRDGDWYHQDPRRLEARLFQSAITGPGLLHGLTHESQGVLHDDVAEARRRLAGILFGPDEKQTCIVLTLTEAGARDYHRVVGRGMLGQPPGKLLEVAAACGLSTPTRLSVFPATLERSFLKSPKPSGPQLRLGGPAVDRVAIDQESQITLLRLVGLCGMVGCVMSWICFRNLAVTCMIFFVGGMGAIGSLAVVYWSGYPLDAVVMSMPAVVYILGLAAAIHMVNYYRDAAETLDTLHAPTAALRNGFLPCTLAALTTAVGLLTLTTSDLLPIQKFGVFTASGVLLSSALLFAYLPASLQVWPPAILRRNRIKPGVPRTNRPRRIDRFWQAIGAGVMRRHGWISAATVLVMGLGVWGLLSTRTTVEVFQLLDRESVILQDYHWLETQLGKLVPLELVVRMAPECLDPREPDPAANNPPRDTMRYSLLERMELCEHVAEAIDRAFGEQGTGILSPGLRATTFVPRLPPPGAGIRDAMHRRAFSRQLEEHKEELLASNYLASEAETGAELWRISLRLTALHPVDYGQFLHQLKSVVEPIMQAHADRARILRDMIAQRPDHNCRRARVYLVGMPTVRQVPTEPQPFDPTTLYCSTLHRLLKSAGVRVANEANLPKTPDGALALAPGDGVLMVGPSTGLEFQLARQGSGVLIDARQHRFDSMYARTAAERKAPISTVYTGLVPVVYQAQNGLLNSLIDSTSWAFATIGLAMVLLVRSLRGGLVAMLPNIFPIVVVFGGMGWLGIPIDIGTMMTSSVAMGVAVDGTIHFLSWYRRGLAERRGRQNAILLAYRRVAAAVTQSTLIAGIGLAMFAFSTFRPTQRFGVVMLALLATSLLGELIVLPALLAGPLGRLFLTSNRQRAAKGAMPTEQDSIEACGDEPTELDQTTMLPLPRSAGQNRAA